MRRINIIFERIITSLVILFTLGSLGAVIWFMFDSPFNDGSGVRDASVFGQYGDFIGGLVGTIFTIAGFMILYRTFILQRRDFRTT